MITIAWLLFLAGVAFAMCGAFIGARALPSLLAARKKLAANPLFAAGARAETIGRSFAEASLRSADASRRLASASESITATLGSAADYAASVALLATAIEEILALFVPDLRGEAS